MVLDAQGVLADEIFFEDIDDALHGGRIAPAGSLADAGEPGVGGDADYIAIADEEGFYLFNFHFITLRELSGGYNLGWWVGSIKIF